MKKKRKPKARSRVGIKEMFRETLERRNAIKEAVERELERDPSNENLNALLGKSKADVEYPEHREELESAGKSRKPRGYNWEKYMRP